MILFYLFILFLLQIQTLIDMGFDRDAVLHALASTGNDINQATAILVSST